MKEEFKIFKDKLNINIGSDPEISFGHIGLKDQFNDYKGEFLVFAYSYIVSKSEFEGLENDENLILDMDVEMNNFVKMYTTSFLTKMQISSQYYNFITSRKPLITLNEYFEIIKKDNDFNFLLKESLKDEIFNQEKVKNDKYVRFSLSVCFPENVHMQPEIAIDMGVDFMEHFDMEDLDIEKIQCSYNRGVDGNNKEKPLLQTNTYYFYLNNLGCLLDMPFNSKGKVYKNNRTNEAPYIYETDTMLFDFLDEYHKSPILLYEMEIVVEDVNKIVDAIKKNT